MWRKIAWVHGKDGLARHSRTRAVSRTATRSFVTGRVSTSTSRPSRAMAGPRSGLRPRALSSIPARGHGTLGRAYPYVFLITVESRTGAPTVGSGGGSVAFASGLSPAPLVTFPVPAHRTVRADFPHTALGRDHAFAHGGLAVRKARRVRCHPTASCPGSARRFRTSPCACGTTIGAAAGSFSSRASSPSHRSTPYASMSAAV